jgi:hypothetical protein
MPSDPANPYRVERIDTDAGERWRLTGPGFTLKPSRGAESEERLSDLASLMGHAYAAGFEAGRAQMKGERNGQATATKT